MFHTQEKYSDEALTFDNSHICKRGPTEITEFYLQSTESSEVFCGIVCTDVSMVKANLSDPNNNTKQTSSHEIYFELTDGTPVSSQVQKENDDSQVLYTNLLFQNISLISQSQLAKRTCSKNLEWKSFNCETIFPILLDSRNKSLS